MILSFYEDLEHVKISSVLFCNGIVTAARQNNENIHNSFVPMIVCHMVKNLQLNMILTGQYLVNIQGFF